MDSIALQIQSELATWSGVTMEAHRGGMLFFYLGRRELGHLHGERMADFPFPVRIRERLVAERKADPHYLHPQTGWTTYYIHGREDIPAIIELFRMNYDRPWLRLT